MVDAVGQAPLFGFFFAMCLVSAAFVLFFVPETKGKTLEQIEAMMIVPKDAHAPGGK